MRFSRRSPAVGAAAPETTESSVDRSSALPQPSVLGRTVVLKGELSFGELLVIQGQVHGSVTGTASVVIEKTANVSGELSADLIRVQQGAPLNGVVLTGCIQRISNKKK